LQPFNQFPFHQSRQLILAAAPICHIDQSALFSELTIKSAFYTHGWDLFIDSIRAIATYQISI
jgi:hypothetical protein